MSNAPPQSLLVPVPLMRVRTPPSGEVELPLPEPATPLSAGVDLRADIPGSAPLVLQPGGRVLVPTGIVLALPPGIEGQVRPRSGLALRHGVTVLNAPGTIDADYRGEVGVLLIHHGHEPFTIRRGDRIAQLVLSEVRRPHWIPTETIPPTGGRGAAGYGSTGVG